MAAHTAVPLATLERWSSLTSLEPFAATLVVDDDGGSEITVNARVVVTPLDHLRVERWATAAQGRGVRLAVMDETAAFC